MAISMPSIQVNFSQLASSLISRSERGRAIVIVKDNTDEDIDYIKLKSSADLDDYSYSFTEENLSLMKDTLTFAPAETYIFRMSAKDPAPTQERNLGSVLKKIVEVVKTGWVTIAGGESSDFDTLASWVKSKEKENYTYKAITYQANTTDSVRIVNFYNDEVTFADERGLVTGENYLPSLVGILASCSVTKGCTYFNCSNLSSVKEVDDRDSFLGKGRFILFNDEGEVKIALGINSLTTTNGSTLTEDMKFIDIIEAMDLIKDDISKVFKETYLGNYPNNYNNQMLLVGSIRSYFKDLANDSILDDSYDNICEIDAEAIKEAWLGVGKTDAESWTDEYAIKQSFKRSVFLKADIKIVGTMENFKFDVSLF